MYHPSTSNSSVSVADASFSNPWSGSGAEIGNSTFPNMERPFHIWDNYSHILTSSSRAGAAGDQTPVPPTVLRTSRSHADMPRSGSVMPPFLVGHSYSSGMRSSSSVASGAIPPYPGSNARNRDRVQALQAYYQQQPSGGPAIHSHTGSSARRFTSHRGMVASSSEQSSGPFFMPTNSSPGHNLQELEDPVSTRFPAREREPLSSGWAFSPLPSTGGSEPSIRPGIFPRRHGSERTP
ncbi:hypothetical protein SAY87_004609 [Trapa incisa]|uniref:Uncharacterized protein n=1 Tax=Trapa incisa TaxID=236973 RepID=A0AAN7PKZ2_9MYRT|nr:hypothetical protein SAY87_004609 [Trapa incisa]